MSATISQIEDLSLEERVGQAQIQLALIYAWATLKRDEIAGIDQSEVLHQIEVAAQEAASLLQPLRKVPGSIGNWVPEGGAR